MLGDAVLAAFEWSGEYGFYFAKAACSSTAVLHRTTPVRMSGAYRRRGERMRCSGGRARVVFCDMEDYWSSGRNRRIALDETMFPMLCAGWRECRAARASAEQWDMPFLRC
ncbi:MAG: hypothetical protein ACLT98_10280 [Eggerthellaceae bacterium]